MVKNFHRALELAKAIKQENFNFNVFMACLGHGIEECLLMACLGHGLDECLLAMTFLDHVGSLKSK